MTQNYLKQIQKEFPQQLLDEINKGKADIDSEDFNTIDEFVNNLIDQDLILAKTNTKINPGIIIKTHYRRGRHFIYIHK